MSNEREGHQMGLQIIHFIFLCTDLQLSDSFCDAVIKHQTNTHENKLNQILIDTKDEGLNLWSWVQQWESSSPSHTFVWNAHIYKLRLVCLTAAGNWTEMRRGKSTAVAAGVAATCDDMSGCDIGYATTQCVPDTFGEHTTVCYHTPSFPGVCMLWFCLCFPAPTWIWFHLCLLRTHSALWLCV